MTQDRLNGLTIFSIDYEVV